MRGEVWIDGIIIRPALVAFVAAMERRLRKNDHKGEWTEMNLRDLHDLFDEEAGELTDEILNIANLRRHNLPHEAEDVALVAFFLWDQAQESPSRERGWSVRPPAS